MVVLTLIATAISIIAGYSAYGSVKQGTEKNITSAMKSYAKPYGLGLLALLVGGVSGITSAASGQLAASLTGIAAGILGVLIVGTISIYDYGFKAAKVAKENPKEAMAVASAAMEAQQKVDEYKEEKKRKKEIKEHNQEIEDIRSRAEFAMSCPSCGCDWLYASGSLAFNSEERVGFNIIGYDDFLDHTELQCIECSATKKIDGDKRHMQ